MNWEIVGALGELFGGLAVVFSVLYLAYQVRESRLQALAEGQRALLTTTHLYTHLATTPGATKDWRDGLNRYADLDPDTQARFHHLMHPHINHVEAVFRMHENGLIDEESYERWMAGIVGVITSKGGRDWWSQVRGLFGPSYVAALEQMRDDPERDTPPLTEFWPFYADRSEESEAI